jgi:hypothetical protein
MNLRVRTVHALSAMATATLDRDTALEIDERQEAEQKKGWKKVLDKANCTKRMLDCTKL